MKKTIRSLKYITILGLILVISISCDNDFTNIETNIQGVKNFEGSSKKFPFVTRTKTFTPFTPSGNNDEVGVSTNNLNGNLFGIYRDPTLTFGTTTASVTAQVIPVTFNPDFGDVNQLRTVESVFLNIPYFSTLESTDEEGNNTYTLDSVFGNTNQAFKLSIFRNNYVLRDLDPNLGFQSPQCYYSNQGDLFESNADLLYENNAFKINANENTVSEIIDGEIVTERFPPGIRINLLKSGPNDVDNDNTNFWENVFFANQGNDELSTTSNFKDFFRGLIIKVESLPGNPINSITYLDFNAGNIVFDYTNQEEINANASGETLSLLKTTAYRLEFNGNRVNTFEQTGVENHDGDQENLYLKGTEGSMAVLELFSGNVENEDGVLVPALNFFNSKKGKWLINEANLVFYVNQDLVDGDGANEPNRLTLYDLKNNTPIIDYFLDGSTSVPKPTFSKIGFSEILERDDNNKGVKYKIRLTSHVINILQNDSTNVKLGLFVANNVNNLSQSKIQGKNRDDDDTTLNIVPSTSVLTPKSTILHGYNDNVSTPLRAEFEIFYTEPEN